MTTAIIAVEPISDAVLNVSVQWGQKAPLVGTITFDTSHRRPYPQDGIHAVRILGWALRAATKASGHMLQMGFSQRLEEAIYTRSVFRAEIDKSQPVWARVRYVTQEAAR